MGFATGLMVFFILWWVVIFTVLPFGVRTVEEEGGTVEQGHAPSAPVRPMLLKKALITTAITAVLWLGVYIAVEANLIDFQSMADRMR